jgi:hypothetical protein
LPEDLEEIKPEILERQRLLMEQIKEERQRSLMGQIKEITDLSPV